MLQKRRTGSSTGASESGGRRLSASGALVALAVVAGVLLVAAAGLVTLLEQPERRARQQLEAQEHGALLARGVEMRTEALRQSLRAIGSSEALVQALRQRDRERLGELARLYQAAFPDALRLLIVPAALNPAPDASPPIGYALVEQVERSREQGAGNIEVHRPGRSDSHLNIVEPVTETPDQAGILVLSAPLRVISEAVTVNGGERVRLIQSTSAGEAAFVSLGNDAAAGASATSPVGELPWRLEYTLDTPASALAGLDPLRLASIIGGGLLLLVGATWLLRTRLVDALKQEGEALVRFSTDLRDDRPPRPHDSRVAELADAWHRAHAATRETQPAAPPRRAAGGTDAEPDDTATFQGSGLEVTELDEGGVQMTDDDDTLASETNQVAIDASVFRAYDIRGVVGESLTESAVRAIGQAIGSEAAGLGQSEIVVGYDGRHSSPALAAALREGMTAAGRAVIDLGQVPTPVVYFAAHQLGTQAGVMVTGSHNPPAYNGLKTVLGGHALWGEGIQRLRERIESGRLESGRGSERRVELLTEYLERIAGDITLHRPLKVVVDCGNGVPGITAPAVLRAIGCDVEELYCEVDGDFPNHHPDPTIPENLEALISHVRLQGADLGIALDGDGDRLGVVDDRGHIIWADRLMMLFARDVLGRNPGTDIIFDVKCTSRLADVITENAGVPVMWKTGHSLIKEKLRETGALLAGEMSGHIFFVERWYGFDDGVYAAARLLEILSMDPRPASEVFAELPEGTSTPEIRIDLAEGEPPEMISRLLAAADELPDARATTIDGLRLDFSDGWGLARASNTQPALVLRFEGDDEHALARIQALFRERLLSVKPDLKLPF